MKLFINELCKIKTSRSVKGIIILFLFFAGLSGTMWGPGKSMLAISRYGFGVPFTWLFVNGAGGFFLYAVIVAGLLANEFESGVIHNALGRGVKRSGYFFAKVIAIFSISILIYVGCICVLFLFKCWTVGFDPLDQIFADYGLKVVTYNGWGILSLLSYIGIYIFIACLFREAVSTFIASLVITILDLVKLFRGPIQIAMDSIRFIADDTILSSDFAKLFVPCIYILVISLAAAYVLFLVQDVA